jgi:hypothetical protein
MMVIAEHTIIMAVIVAGTRNGGMLVGTGMADMESAEPHQVGVGVVTDMMIGETQVIGEVIAADMESAETPGRTGAHTTIDEQGGIGATTKNDEQVGKGATKNDEARQAGVTACRLQNDELHDEVAVARHDNLPHRSAIRRTVTVANELKGTMQAVAMTRTLSVSLRGAGAWRM